MMMFDDVGSFPFSQGDYLKVVEDVMRMKLMCGLDVPAYPQLRDMNTMFSEILEDEKNCEQPFLVRREKAEIVEMKAVEKVAREWKKETGEVMKIKVCVTGPVELYLHLFGTSNYPDILVNIARSVRRFFLSSLSPSYRVQVVSIDEPSLGLNPAIMFSEEDILEALDIASAHRIETQIHLHSALYSEVVCNSNVDIIGVECASEPSNLELIDRRLLEDTDTFLRVGIARTDIHAMVSELNERYSTNVWRDESLMRKVVEEMETPNTIASRLRRAWEMFGDRIRYVGPDCGLGSWPSQELACELLRNTKQGINAFCETRDSESALK